MAGRLNGRPASGFVEGRLAEDRFTGSIRMRAGRRNDPPPRRTKIYSAVAPDFSTSDLNFAFSSVMNFISLSPVSGGITDEPLLSK